MNSCKHRDCILLLTVSKTEFRGQFSYLDKLQDREFLLCVESQSELLEFQYHSSVWYLVSIDIHVNFVKQI